MEALHSSSGPWTRLSKRVRYCWKEALSIQILERDAGWQSRPTFWMAEPGFGNAWFFSPSFTLLIAYLPSLSLTDSQFETKASCVWGKLSSKLSSWKTKPHLESSLLIRNPKSGQEVPSICSMKRIWQFILVYCNTIWDILAWKSTTLFLLKLTARLLLFYPIICIIQ